MRSFLGVSMFVVLGVVACGGTKEEPKTPESTVTATKVEPAPTATPTTTEKAEDKAEKKADKAEDKAEKKADKAEKKAEKKKTPKEVVTAPGAVFMFSLADSEGAKKAVDEDCAKKAKKDDKKLEACKKEAETDGADEGIRFEKDDKGDWYWVSFGKEKDKEVVYNKVKFTLGDEAEGKLTLKPEGKDLGKKPMKAMPKEVVLEVPDEATVVMNDPKKGKVVYKKK